jgi:hypothetical protein
VQSNICLLQRWNRLEKNVKDRYLRVSKEGQTEGGEENGHFRRNVLPSSPEEQECEKRTVETHVRYAQQIRC